MKTQLLALGLLSAFSASTHAKDLAIKAETIYPMTPPSGGAAARQGSIPTIRDGVILIRDGKIEAIGTSSQVAIPRGTRVVTAKVATPGLIDAHSVVGLTGYLNQAHDQEQIDVAASVQPELRATDAYDPRERLISWVRSFGVTTLHTGHGPGALVSGQTMIVKTRGGSVEDAQIVPEAMIAATVGEAVRPPRDPDSRAPTVTGAPGTRSKALAILRAEFVAAREYDRKRNDPEKGKETDRNLKHEMLLKVLRKELPLLVTVQRAHDILGVLRLAEEFSIRVVLDGAVEAPLVVDRIKASGVPVIVHPTMSRANGESENLSFETASVLRAKGIPIALQSGFEAYVPKTRVVLFEAALAAANGLSFEEALALVTRDAAKLLGIDKRVGTLEKGKDGDVALYDGDPFEYTTHCIGTVIEGELVSEREEPLTRLDPPSVPGPKTR